MNKAKSVWFSVYDYHSYVECGTVFLGAVIFFGWYWRLRKPTFVWVMWGLFVLSEVFYLA